MPSHITYELTTKGLSPVAQQTVSTLYEKVFNTGSERITERLKRSDLVTVLARSAGQVVGFKMGYPEKPNRFYSWLGGVHLAWQRQGIAHEMMRRQHAYCLNNGFVTIRTKTTNRWRAMLILNIRTGFSIIGTYVDDANELKIILEKRLNT